MNSTEIKAIQSKIGVVPDGIIMASGKQVMVSEEDAQHLSKFRWFVDSKGYAYRHNRSDGKDSPVRMHRQILSATSGADVDHINRNRLDNRRCNLRLCRRSENLWNSKKKPSNTSGFKGVDFRPARNKFRARIRAGKVRLNLGNFDTAEQAYAAYVSAAKIHHGDFACYD